MFCNKEREKMKINYEEFLEILLKKIREEKKLTKIS